MANNYPGYEKMSLLVCRNDLVGYTKTQEMVLRATTSDQGNISSLALLFIGF